MEPSSVTDSEFSALMHACDARALFAVAVSGGADSMALLLLAQRYAPCNVTALTIDHGLRKEAADEAAQVANWCKALGVAHHTLSWSPQQLTSAVQEQARDARYELLSNWCRKHKIETLLTAHHRDDQAETLFFRLARGSGLDGLACMQPVMQLDGVRLLRPLLSVPKARLIATLQQAGQEWIEDPSNQNPRYTRSRIRAALAETGELEQLSARAYAVTQSFAHARNLMENKLASKLTSCIGLSQEGAVIDTSSFIALEPEYGLRALAKISQRIGGGEHKPRTHKLERFYEAIISGALTKKRTLAGCIFDPRPKENRIYVTREIAKAA